jgi:hypothetical protein
VSAILAAISFVFPLPFVAALGADLGADFGAMVRIIIVSGREIVWDLGAVGIPERDSHIITRMASTSSI